MRKIHFNVRLILAFVLLFIIFTADLYIRPGFNVFILYFLPLLLVWKESTGAILSIAAVSTIIQVLRITLLSQETALSVWLTRLSEIAVIWFVVFISFTHQKFTSKINRQEQQLRRQVLVLDQVQEAVVIIDNQTKITYMNAAAYRLYDISPEEPVLGSTLGEYFIFKWQSPQQFEEYNTAIKTKGVWKGEKTHITHKQRQFWGESVISLVKDESGKPTGVAAVIRDISQKKQAQSAIEESREKVLLATEAAGMGIWSIEVETLKSDWDITSRRHWGFGPDEELTSDKIMSRVHPDDRSKLERAFILLQRGKPVYSMELRIVHPDGTVHYMSSIGRALKDSSGNVRRLIGTSLDMTSRVLSEQKIKQLNSDLKSRAQDLMLANRELEAFSYSVSHDLRSPLRSIIGLSSILAADYRQCLDQEGTKIIDQITESSKKMNQLIEDFLNLSRVTRQELSIKEVDLSAVASDIISELQKKEPGRKIDIRIEQVPLSRADSGLMQIALHNLLDNSWKYTRKKENAEIEFGSLEKNGERVFFVRDNGAGFDLKYADSLFEPFKRLHTENEFTGSGIGLSIVKRIIDRHGGSIRAEGEPGKGAVFYFTLGNK